VLRSRDEANWCLCLLPGVHTVGRDLELSGAQNVTLSACGPGTVVSLKDRSLIAGGLATVTLRGFAIDASGSQGLVFRGCQRVLLEQLVLGMGDNPDRSAISCVECEQVLLRELSGEFARLRAIVELQGVTIAHIERCLMAGLGGLAVGIFSNGDHQLLQLSHNRISIRADEAELDHAVLVIEEARRDGQQTILDGNILDGAVSLYGQAGRSPLKEGELPTIARRLPQMRLEALDSAFQARGNRLTRITIGEKALSQLRDGADLAVYRTLQLSDNVISDGDTVLLAARHSLAGNHFTRNKTSTNLGRMLGAVIGTGATFSGNHGEGTDLMLGCAVTQTPPGGNPTATERMMNMILIQRF
jgi:hypothetical protein